MNWGKTFGAILLIATIALIVLTLAIILPSTDATGNDSMETKTFALNYSHFDFDIRMGDVEGYSQSKVLRFGPVELVGYRYYTPEDQNLVRLVETIKTELGEVSELELAKRILEFVQDNIRYVEDENRFLDHYQFPLETLYYGQGDCEDQACLLATLYGIAGINAVLIHEMEHLTVGVDVPATGSSVTMIGSDTEFYLAESCCNRGLGVGEIPFHLSFPPDTTIFLLGFEIILVICAILCVWVVRQ